MKTSISWGLAAMLAVAAGCSNDAPVGGCNVDDDCPSGQFCSTGGCTAECTGSPGECDPGATCDVSRGRCVRLATDGGVPDGAADGGQICGADAQCDDGMFCTGVERCDPTATSADDRGCVAGPSPCATGGTCDESTDACTVSCDADLDGNGNIDADNDGDSHRSLACDGDDCDDSDGDRYPRSGAEEVCAPSEPDHDEDCNPCTIASFFSSDGDVDGDHYIDEACTNPFPPGVDPATHTCPAAIATRVSIDAEDGLVRGTDCDDALDTGPDVHPNEAESCNTIDDNCDGRRDEEVQVPVYLDCDGDGHGDPTTLRDGCDGELAGAADACPGTGHWVLLAGDPMDCDFGPGAEMRNESQAETCNTIDDDCDGVPDDGVLSTYYGDLDGDGFGSAASGTTTACMAPTGYVANMTDCEDGAAGDDLTTRMRHAATHPGASELCNSDNHDEDCDGVGTPAGCACMVDVAGPACGSGLPGCASSTLPCRQRTSGVSSYDPCPVTDTLITCWRDGDGDQWAASGAATARYCSCPTGVGQWTSRDPAGGADCNDAYPGGVGWYPGAIDYCDGINTDCAGATDPGVCTSGTERGATDSCGAPTIQTCIDNGTGRYCDWLRSRPNLGLLGRLYSRYTSPAATCGPGFGPFGPGCASYDTVNDGCTVRDRPAISGIQGCSTFTYSPAFADVPGSTTLVARTFVRWDGCVRFRVRVTSTLGASTTELASREDVFCESGSTSVDLGFTTPVRAANPAYADCPRIQILVDAVDIPSSQIWVSAFQLFAP